jgi:predicted 3-demethylubiquinone-9 3-methyltransferase (glyoxalase superfamily)
VLEEMLRDKDPDKANRVMKVMLQMSKMDIAALKRAYTAED